MRVDLTNLDHVVIAIMAYGYANGCLHGLGIETNLGQT